MSEASAPGKIILFGEHAVVYGRPAIAVPVWQVSARARVEAAGRRGVIVEAPDIGRRYELDRARQGDPLAAIIRLACTHLERAPAGMVVHVHSTIPVARGLGSGAAVSIATARALGLFFGRELSAEEASALAYEVEKLHHGTPSGVDNTVIAYGQPIFFIKDKPFEPFRTALPFWVAIADTGVPSSTRITVGDVRRAWEADRRRYEELFDRIGQIVLHARDALEQGDIARLGELMNENQTLLEQVGVSSREIERLVEAARNGGALGAKLSGGGRGGNVIALLDEAKRGQIEDVLAKAGAAKVIVSEVTEKRP